MSRQDQQEFDFSRGRQLTLLRMASIPAVKLTDGKTVASASMKAVLAAIDSHAGKEGECWASAATLAVEVGLSERSVRRAIAGLKMHGLIIERSVREGRSTFKHRRLCFPNLADFEVKRDARGNLIHPETVAVHPETVAVHPETGSSSPGDCLPQREQKEPIKKSVKGTATASNGFFEMFQGEEFTPLQLKDPQFLDRVYQAAVQHCDFPETDFWKRSLFGFGARCWRKRRELQSSTGFFFCGIGRRSRDWLLKQVDDNDRDHGKRLIEQLDGDTSQRSAEVLQDRTFAAEMDFERERQRQLAALAAEFGEQR